MPLTGSEHMKEEQKPLSKHEQRGLERKQREEAHAVEIASIVNKKKLRHSVIWFVTILLISGLFWWGTLGSRIAHCITQAVKCTGMQKLTLRSVAYIIHWKSLTRQG